MTDKRLPDQLVDAPHALGFLPVIQSLTSFVAVHLTDELPHPIFPNQLINSHQITVCYQQ
jgi:hypothetical protein